MVQDNKNRVLVVDDDSTSADLLAEALTLMGYDSAVAYGGRTALHIASYYLPEVVLIDLVMPDLDGYEVAAALRESTSSSQVRLIAVTASVDALSRHKAISSGFNDFIVKPAKVSALIDAIEQQLRFEDVISKHWRTNLAASR